MQDRDRSMELSLASGLHWAIWRNIWNAERSFWFFTSTCLLADSTMQAKCDASEMSIAVSIWNTTYSNVVKNIYLSIAATVISALFIMHIMAGAHMPSMQENGYWEIQIIIVSASVITRLCILLLTKTINIKKQEVLEQHWQYQEVFCPDTYIYGRRIFFRFWSFPMTGWMAVTILRPQVTKHASR